MNILTATIPGKPVGSTRPRVYKTHTSPNDKAEAWQGLMIMVFRGAYKGAPVDAPVFVNVECWHSRPKRLRRKKDPRGAMWAVCKPDLDNVVKNVLDALVKAGVLVDDTRVVVLGATRHYLPINADGLDMTGAHVVVDVTGGLP